MAWWFRGSGLAALTPQPPEHSVVEVRGALATSLETTHHFGGIRMPPSTRIVSPFM
jgi:hypothetical protein